MKTFWLAICLPLALLACKEGADAMEEAPQGAIGFTTEVITGDTRAAVLNLSDLKDAGFRVSAYYTGTEDWSVDARGELFMDNQHVEWNELNWTYAPVKYWPGKVSFFAWNEITEVYINGSPLSVFQLGVEGQPILNYIVPNAVAEQHDLVADVLWNETTGPVPFTFRHLLSRIGFTATPESGNVIVESLKVKYTPDAVKSMGAYIFGAEDHAEERWEVSNARFMEGEEVLTPDDYLMLIPQPVDAGAITVEVSWLHNGSPMPSQTLALPAQVWRQGKRYNYNIKVGQTEATLDPVTVDPWDTDARYEACTLTYNANYLTTYGMGVDVDDLEAATEVRPYMTNVAYPLEGADMFTRPEFHTFAGWNTKPGGDGKNYMPGDLFACGDDATLYAQWKGFDCFNCYIMAPGDARMFSVARAYVNDGNGSAKLRIDPEGEDYIGQFTAEVLWGGASVDAVASEHDYGRTAWMMVEAFNEGNAVVVLKKRGTDTIVWSYHIWVTDYDPNENTFTNPNNGLVFMDRNLGAMEAGVTEAAYGLYYQWGRKDPFPTTGDVATEKTDDEKGTVAWSIQHPDVFLTANTSSQDWLATRDDTLWGHGAAKSVYDPCPNGWRVPAHTDEGSPWEGLLLSAQTTGLAGDGFSWGDNAIYPTAGYRRPGYGDRENAHQWGMYWTATPTDDGQGLYLYYYPGIIETDVKTIRAVALPLRCVRI